MEVSVKSTSLFTRYIVRTTITTLCMVSMGSSMFFLNVTNIAYLWKANPGLVIYFFTMLILSQLYLMLTLLVDIKFSCQNILKYILQYAGFVIAILYLIFGTQLLIQSLKVKQSTQMYNYILACSDIVAGITVLSAEGLYWLYTSFSGDN